MLRRSLSRARAGVRRGSEGSPFAAALPEILRSRPCGPPRSGLTSAPVIAGTRLAEPPELLALACDERRRRRLRDVRDRVGDRHREQRGAERAAPDADLESRKSLRTERAVSERQDIADPKRSIQLVERRCAKGAVRRGR